MAKALKRFLVSGSLRTSNGNSKVEATTILLTPEETHHLKNVLRMKEGSLCLLFDRNGNEFISRIEHYLPDAHSEARLIKAVPKQKGSSLHLTVAQAIPQDRKMDDIVRTSAELGIFELIPMFTERTVVRMAKDQRNKVHERWERIVAQTLKQSRLSIAPAIRSITPFSELCSDFSSYDQVFLLHPSDEAKPIRDSFLKNRLSANARILLMIGPEGGFSPKEVTQAKTGKAQIIRMGAGVLKTDTAFVAASSFFQLMCHDILNQ
ncbi:MAG: hypothetical protein A3C35_07845 [Omnitrophica bacterium RIFCSPHIGHO2_02_FULL_46_11]|nr:MAG: hypothetical protein A3A81_05415 [Omnitrophica bacterium RIFCSPLOWO2_01_FULL_45_10b]OGW86874.1 MAG: hypothetical protein A3C35_07845 [Omnitrophica bacterium RIFCSPHIGHO2_02_FULL_46_11]